MPSFLGRFIGISFRTERLIMNIIGLVNSTLDWHPLKWTNKLEQIWNLSLSQQTIILETIGEERIKSVLSYIVIARILIAHVFTLSYMTNFYPIITWSRPNLLLPWLVLSFFKNVVLEVIVIAVGLLFWYDKRFSLPIFLEFVFVKVVPLLFATYNWYSNSCLYLELRRIEKIRKLRRNMRSDSNLMVSRLYLKLAESRYRTRSMTTLISWESYDTNDTNDTISRIIEDTNLSPAQKVKKILRLSEQDIEDARNRAREREMHRRLTEVEDETFSSSPRNISRYFSMVSHYDLGTKILFSPKDEFRKDEVERERNKDKDDSKSKVRINERVENIDATENLEEKNGNISLENPSSSSITNSPKPEISGPTKTNSQTNPKETINNPASKLAKNPENSPKTVSKELNLKTTEATELFQEDKTKQLNQNPSNNPKSNNNSASTNKSSKLNEEANLELENEDKKSSTKLQAFFNCNCIADDFLFKGRMEESNLMIDDVAMRTSTPKNSPEKRKEETNMADASEDSKSSSNRSKTNNCVEIDEKTDLQRKVDDCFLVEKLLTKDLDILKNIKMEEERLGCKSERDVLVEVVDQEVENGPSKLFRGERDKVDVEKLSKIVKNFSICRDLVDNLEILETVEAGECFGKEKIESRVEGSTLESVECAVSDGANFVQRSMLNPYKQSIDRDFLNINLPEYSFGDTNIPRFYKDSMKIFDGCYEKDFANNSELQCLLKQLEKKKWSLFPGQTGHEFLRPSNFLIENDQFVVQDLRTVCHLTSDFNNFGRHEILSASSRPNHEQLTPQILQSTKKTQDHKLNPTQKPHNPTRDISTQTSFETKPKIPPSNLMDLKKRRKSSLKRKRTKEEVKNHSTISSINPINNRRTDSQSSLQNAKISSHQTPRRTLETHKKPSLVSEGKSLSEKSVCECRMPQANQKRSTEWKLQEKSSTKIKVENFRTIPLSQVAKPSLFDSVIYGRKPPVYPKKTRHELATQSSSAAPSTKKVTASIKKLLEVSRKATEKQSSHSTKKLKCKSKLEDLEEQEAKEMRALKVYNEITLLKDKKELEARKRTPSFKKDPLDGSTENFKSRESKKRRSKRDSPRIGTNDYFGKENSWVDATTETEPLINILPRDNVSLVREKIVSLSSEKYPCAKLSKVNRITDKLLDNFDRLHGGPLRQEFRKNRQSVETDTRKQYTKYSRPKKLLEEENVSISSMKKVEGTQLGRELERVQAKKDVRNNLETSVTSSGEQGLVGQSGRDFGSRDSCYGTASSSVMSSGEKGLVGQSGRDYCYGAGSTSMGGRRLERKDGNSFMTIKSTVMQDVMASWSSSSLEQGEEMQIPEQDDPGVTNSGPEASPRIQPEIIQEEAAFPKTFTKIPSKSSKGLLPIDKRTQLQPRSPQERSLGTLEASPRIQPEIIQEEAAFPKTITKIPSKSSKELLSRDKRTQLQLRSPQERSLGTPEASLELVSPSPGESSTDFVRSIEVSRTYNTVILSNPSAPKEEKPQRRNIVDDDTIRMIHHAFSDRSIDFILDLSSEILSMNSVLNNGQLRIENEEFTFQPNIETMGVPMEELPPLPQEQQNFRRQILATICRFQNSEQDIQDAASCQIDLPINSVMEETDEFDEDEEIYPMGSHELEINAVLSSVVAFLRCLNADEFTFGNISGVGYEILQDMLDEEDELEFDEENEEDEEETGMQSVVVERFLRFVQEDVCTDIRFPVLIRWSDMAAILNIPNEEELNFQANNMNLLQMELSKVNFFCLEDAEDELIVVDGTSEEDYRKEERRIELEEDSNVIELFSDRFANLDDLGNSPEVLEDTLIEERRRSSLKEKKNYRFVEYFNAQTRISSGMEEFFENSSRDYLNRTYELSRDTEEEEEEEEYADILNEDVEEEDTGRIVEVQSVSRMEEIVKKMESFEKEEIRLSENKQWKQAMEKDFLKNPEENNERLSACLIAEEEERRTELDRKITLKIILTFWLAVFYFYFRYFYEKIFSFGQVSRSQATLKPFEIHAVPTSTTTLLEITRLGKKITEEKMAELEENEGEEENDVLETIVNFEAEENLSSLGSLLNFESTTNSSVSQNSETPNKGRFNEIEKEVEKTMLYLSKRVTENVKILPFFTSEESIAENNQEGAAIIDSKILLSDTGSQLISPGSQSNPSGKLKKIGPEFIGRSFILQKEEQLELPLAEREIETLRYEEDERKLQSGFLCAEIELEEAEEISVEAVEISIETEEISAKAEEISVQSEEISAKAEEISIETEEISVETEEISIETEEISVEAEEISVEAEEISIETEEISVQAEEMLSDVDREETNSFNSSVTTVRRQRHLEASKKEETIRNEEINNSTETKSLGRDSEEQKSVMEQKMASSLSQIPNVYTQSTDSFDSNYTGISESSKNTASAGDLNASSMEEFAD